MTVLSSVPGFELAGPGEVDYRTSVKLGFERVLRGVYGRGRGLEDLDEWERRWVGYIRLVQAVMSVYAGKGAVLFGSTALQVMGVALPPGLADWDNVHILVPHGVSRGDRRGVITHQTRQPLVVWRLVYNLPVLHPVFHWLQLRGATDDQMIEVGDGLLRNRDPWLTREQMETELAKCKGLTGAVQARRVFPLVRAGTDSIRETRVRLILVRAGLPEPVVNHNVYCAGVGIMYSVDLGYEAEKIAVEYDGGIHATVEQMQKDAQKRRCLQDERWLVIVVTAADLRQPNQIVNSVETALVMRRAAMTPR